MPLILVHCLPDNPQPLTDVADAGLPAAGIEDRETLTVRDWTNAQVLTWSQVEAHGNDLILVVCADDELAATLVSQVRSQGGRIVVLSSLTRHWCDVADVVSPQEELVEVLRNLLQEPQVEPEVRDDVKNYLSDIYDLLRRRLNLEFRHYRQGFALRRIEQRMKMLQLTNVLDYLQVLQSDVAEVRRLGDSFSVRVTQFFRDPRTFEALRDRLRELFSKRPRLRLWSAGCATGEEAYSLAILACEVAEEMGHAMSSVRILATDSNEVSLRQGRKGEYGFEIKDQVSEKRLKRYFQPTTTGYSVAPDIRQMVQFSQHNLLTDPPFNEIDLLLCRNVLIYLSAAIHEKLLCIFHYSLRPGGFLLLGSSETAGESTPLYTLMDEHSRLYRRVDGPASVGWLPAELMPPHRTVSAEGRVDMTQLVQGILQHEFSPRAVVVGDDGRIVWSSGGLEPYLSLSHGVFRNQIVQLARKGLKNAMRSALLEARQTRRTMRRAGIRLEGREGEPSTLVDLTVQPMPEMGDGAGLFLVVFQEGPERQTTVQSGASDEDRIHELERELARVSEDLERTVQDLESANEELKSSNEELWAINEELRTANEELEKSRSDVESKNTQLNRANLDLSHLLTSTHIPTLFLDHEQRLLRYTPSAEEIYYIIPSDLGRPIWQVRDRAVSMPPLPTTGDESVSEEVELSDGRFLVRKTLPYLDLDGKSLGLVVTFTDITDLRRSRQELHRSLSELQSVYDHAQVGLASLDADLRVTRSNPFIHQLTGLEEGLPPELQQAAERVLNGGQPERDLEFTRAGRDCLASLYPVPDHPGRFTAVVHDVTPLKQREREQQAPVQFFERLTQPVWIADLRGRSRFANPAAVEMFGSELSDFRDQLSDDDRQLWRQEILPRVEADGAWSGKVRMRAQGGERLFWLEAQRLEGATRSIGFLARDLEQEHQEMLELQRQKDVFYTLLDTIRFGFSILDHDLRIVYANRQVRDLNHGNSAVGLLPSAFLPSWEGSDSQRMLKKAVSGQAQWGEHYLPDVDSWYDSYYLPIAEGVAVFSVDITHVKRDQRRIRELAAVVDNSSEFIAVYDEAKQLRFINPAGLAMAGLPLDTPVTGLQLSDFHPSWAVTVINDALRGLQAGREWRGETALNVRGGDPIPLIQSLQPLLSADGDLSGFTTTARDITDVKQRERLLRESELRFRRAIVEAPVPVMILAENGELLACSESLYQATGYAPNELGQLNQWLLIAHRQHADGVREQLTELLHGRSRLDFEAPVYTRNGSERLWRFTGTAAGKLEDGRNYAVIMAIDLTDRLEHERVLAESAAHLHRLLDALPHVVAVCTPDGVLTQANRAALAWAGITAPEALGRPFAEIFPAEVTAEARQHAEDATHRAAAGRSSRFDVESHAGTLDMQIVPMRDTAGRVTHLIPSATDITDRKRIASELEAGQERFRALLNSTAEAIYGLNQKGELTFANPACLRMLGHSSSESLLGRNAHALFHHTRPDGTPFPIEECPFRQAYLSQQQVYSPRELFFRPDGSSFWAECWSHPIDSDAGGAVVTFWDITERLQQEAELSSARLAAESASRAKSDFLANMSHEIRTPMAAILGYVDILLRQATDPDNVDCLQIIQRNGQHLLDIINDILDLSKIEAGRLQMELLPVSVQSIINEVLALMDVRAVEKNLKLEVRFDGSLPETISSDPTRLRQILMNLLGNALKFTHEGSVILTVALNAAEELMEFSVIDTGIGMDEATQELLFRPFNQADTSVTRRFGGTGLGLAITGQLVSLMGGTISVQSQLGQGSTFSFVLPTGSLENVELIKPESFRALQPGGPTRNPLPSLEGLKVLVADDRRDIRDLVRSYLEEAGAQVATAPDGQASLDSLDRQPADVLVMDMQMPVLDGYNTARELRRRGSELPILALTASAMKGDREACVEAGCDGYLTKPVDRVSLIHQVSILARRRRTLQVLVVEDNPLAGRAVQAMLNTMGCQTVLAPSGADALKSVAAEVPDYVLIDLGLPDMDGAELLVRLRGLPQLEGTRFIAHSGRDDHEVNAATGPVRFDAVVQKPATRDSLREVLFGSQ